MSNRTFILSNLLLIILGLIFYAAEYFTREEAETTSHSQVEIASPARSPNPSLGTQYRAHRHQAGSDN